MAITNSDWNYTNKTTSNPTDSVAKSNGIVSNPNAQLDKDAFLKLLLIELQHQDPTEPMDSEKILTQTAQLSSLEMQQNTNTTMQAMVATMEKLTASFTSSMSTAAVGAIGKMASVADKTIKLDGEDTKIVLKMYLPEDSDANGVTLEIYDDKGKLVTSNKGEAKEVSKGLFTMEWLGRNSEGVYAGNGNYTAKLIYNNKNGEKVTSEYGTYPIEGIVFDKGVAYAKMGGQKVKFDDIVEISNYKA